jgi:hypothetical protein
MVPVMQAQILILMLFKPLAVEVVLAIVARMVLERMAVVAAVQKEAQIPHLLHRQVITVGLGMVSAAVDLLLQTPVVPQAAEEAQELLEGQVLVRAQVMVVLDLPVLLVVPLKLMQEEEEEALVLVRVAAQAAQVAVEPVVTHLGHQVVQVQLIRVAAAEVGELIIKVQEQAEPAAQVSLS